MKLTWTVVRVPCVVHLELDLELVAHARFLVAQRLGVLGLGRTVLLLGAVGLLAGERPLVHRNGSCDSGSGTRITLTKKRSEVKVQHYMADTGRWSNRKELKVFTLQ